MKSQRERPFHQPVLLNEVINFLQVKPEEWYVDATAGGGGHTQAIINQGGKVLAIDWDEDAIDYLNQVGKTDIKCKRLIIKKDNFAHLKQIIAREKISEVSGIIFDLGTSLHQIKYSGRGFSFAKNEPLDMRISQDLNLTAAEIINFYPKEKLYEIFTRLAEEVLAQQLVEAIVRARALNQIETTVDLGRIVSHVYQQKGIKTKINPATKIFQALRIAVNQELDNLKEALPQAITVLARGGRCLVISFHSLEDRIVKLFFKQQAQLGIVGILTKKPVRATRAEITANPSARSARLRAVYKL